MTLEMDNVTHGRSVKGMNSLIDKFEEHFASINKSFGGEDYKEFIKTLKNNWAGSDASAYIGKFESEIETIKTNITNISKKLSTGLTTDSINYNKFQDKNDILN